MRTCITALMLLMVLASEVWPFGVCGVSSSPASDDQVQGAAGDPAYFVCETTNKCKGYVVLVTFTDQTTGFYKDDDQPYGYSWDLFNQFFNGGYETGVPAYKGTTAFPRKAMEQDVKDADTEAVFGSLRAYFAEVYGGDIIEFELLNKKNTDGSPMWLQLPKSKYDYAALSGGDRTFWNDAEAVVRGDGGTALKSVPTNFPYRTGTFTDSEPTIAARRLRNKAIYVYPGLILGNRSPLHPRVDEVTSSATDTSNIGARMVIGERQGWQDWGTTVSTPTKYVDHTVDRFTGVGIHVHEWGHLFGLAHPNGLWTGTNPHPNKDQLGDFTRANIMGWGAMQDGQQGPFIAGQQSNGTPSNYRLPYGSCPNPYNPFYRMDLGWNSVETITSSQNDKKIRPGPAQIYVVPSVNDQDYLLDFRDVSNTRTGNFGHYAAYKELSSSGLLIWRRKSLTNNSNPMLIPADGRSIFDARDTLYSTDRPDLMYNDLPSDPFGAAVTEATSILEAHFTTNDPIAIANFDNGGANPPFGTIGSSHLAFRNIEIKSDSEGAYAAVDIRFIPLPPTSLGVTAAPTEADPNAVTLSWNAPDPNGTDRILGYQYSTDKGTTWHPSLEANPLALITSSPAPITGLAATDLTFQMRTVTDHPTEGSRPDIDNLSPASDTIVLNRPGWVELTAVEPTSHTPPTVGDELRATVGDANVSNWADADISWHWQRSADGTTWHSAGTSTPLNSTNTATYELTDADVGQQVRVIAEYSDGVFRDPDMAESNSVTVNSRPVITTNTVEATNPSVDENSADVVYTYMATDPDAGNTIRWSLSGTNATLFTINSDGELTFASAAAPDFEALGDDHPYMVDVIASDGSLPSDALAVTVTVNDVDEPPAFADSSPEKVAMDEDIAKVGEYEAVDPEGHPITWSLTGTDASAFELASGSNPDRPDQRTLQFKAAALPNFEVKNSYEVTLQVSSQPAGGGGTAQSASLPVAVEILNAEDVGTLVLQGLTDAPVVGTALVALLTDEDGNISVPVAGWQWQRKQPDETEWEAIAAPAVGSTAETPPAMHSYTPTAADRDHLLRVQVSYTDGYGEEADMLTSAATTGVVTGSDRPPTLTGKPVVPVEENKREVGSYTARDPDGDVVTWRVLTGRDHEAFELTGTNKDAKRTLQFKAAALPNFEQKTRYSVTLTVESTSGSEGEGAASTSSAESGASGANGVQTTALAVTVDITNVEEAGTLVLSPLPPQVDVPLQAELSDADGPVHDVEWEWWRRWPPWQGWRFAQAGPPHTPNQWAAGYQLQVRVSYRDGHGTVRDTLVSAWTDSVRTNVPQAPQQPEAVPLSASSVELSWDAPPSHGGSAIGHYEYRQQEGTEA